MTKITAVYTESNISEIARKIVTTLQPGDTLAFYGDLAAGKTTLIQHILRTLDYKGKVSSPTYVIEHRYRINWLGADEVIHLDLYRLKKEELKSIDWKEIFKPTTIVMIEWPELATQYLPTQTKKIFLKKVNEKTREVTFE